ncbi:MAG: hypothetical protein JWN25_3638 [Verrucomicrobiales bacterium]|nr:hypothetical protein [Verrucomicrobiales bacterium]MDB6131105.1 hypothetical protein [Verrucomicrobiales bacterium]
MKKLNLLLDRLFAQAAFLPEEYTPVSWRLEQAVLSTLRSSPAGPVLEQAVSLVKVFRKGFPILVATALAMFVISYYELKDSNSDPYMVPISSVDTTFLK